MLKIIVKISMVTIFFINSQGDITEAGLQHWLFSLKNYFFRTAEHTAQPPEHTELSSSDLETLS